LTATKRELADARQLGALGDNRSVDLQDQLEMAMLDKEMAEERAEVAETELEEVKERLAVIEVGVEVDLSAFPPHPADVRRFLQYDLKELALDSIGDDRGWPRALRYRGTSV
jgi:cytochrome b involved in lipid metabolism